MWRGRLPHVPERSASLDFQAKHFLGSKGCQTNFQNDALQAEPPPCGGFAQPAGPRFAPLRGPGKAGAGQQEVRAEAGARAGFAGRHLLPPETRGAGALPEVPCQQAPPLVPCHPSRSWP